MHPPPEAATVALPGTRVTSTPDNPVHTPDPRAAVALYALAIQILALRPLHTCPCYRSQPHSFSVCTCVSAPEPMSLQATQCSRFQSQYSSTYASTPDPSFMATWCVPVSHTSPPLWSGQCPEPWGCCCSASIHAPVPSNIAAPWAPMH